MIDAEKDVDCTTENVNVMRDIERNMFALFRLMYYRILLRLFDSLLDFAMGVFTRGKLGHLEGISKFAVSPYYDVCVFY